LTSYFIKYNIRVIFLNDFPDASTGVDTFNGQGSGDDRGVFFAPDGLALASAAGIQPSVSLSTKGLFHVPSKITNPAMAKAVLMFEPNAQFPQDTVAAAIISYPTYKQLSFYVPFGFFSLTSMVLGHVWFQWGTRGLYPGFRRIMFSTHVDDVFLGTETEFNKPALRITAQDMAEVEKWQVDINKRMNPGSDYRLDLCFNGNGVLLESRIPQLPIVDLDDAAYIDVDKEFKKPPGTGIDVWAPIDLNPYVPASITANIPLLKQRDALFNYVHNNAAKYFLNSHTFTHEDLNNCSYRDAFNEIRVNQNFAKAVGFDTQPFWSKHAIVSPGISGVFNADALQAFLDAGITSVVGDITRTNINNDTNVHWPFITSLQSSNFAGFTIIPRAATSIFFNCSTPEQNTKLFNAIQVGLNFNFQDILKAEMDRALYKLMQLHWDAYMFHQANLFTTGLDTTTNPPPGPTAPMSTRNADVKVSGTNNGATAKYAGGNVSILASWSEVVVQGFNQLVTWPLVTYKLDDMETMFNERVKWETSGVRLTINGGSDGFTTFSLTSTKNCTTPLSLPLGVDVKDVVGGLQPGWKTEKRGLDPLTVWVPLDGKSTVTFKLSNKVAF
jgi:hypothetical protein